MSRITARPSVKQYLTPTLCVSVLGAVFFMLVLAYMYFLSMSVVHVVFRKEFHQQARALESEIASLEAKYIEAQHAVSERIASAEVLAETNDKIFVKRDAGALVLSRANN